MGLGDLLPSDVGHPSKLCVLAQALWADAVTEPLPEVRLCRMCYADDEVRELVRYSTRHYAHPSCIADGWWFDRIRLLEDVALSRVRASADGSAFVQLVSDIDAEIVKRGVVGAL